MSNLTGHDAALKIEDAQVEVPEWFTQYLRADLAKTFRTIPDTTVAWLADKVAVFGNPVPIGQIIGFNQFLFQPATTIDGPNSTSSTAYVDLTGPTLTGLAKGSYALFFGCQSSPTAPSVGLMSLEVDGVAVASDVDSIVLAAGAESSASRVVLKDLTLDSGNSITAKYRSSVGDSCLFRRRWMIAVKYQNL